MEVINYTIFTDGAYSPMRKKMGIGLVILRNEIKVYEFSKMYLGGTNNRAELIAVISALNVINSNISSLNIITDSSYVIGCATMGWKRKKNVELWQTYDKVFAKASQFCPEIRFNWVKGHDVSEFNNLADELAVDASHEYNKN